MEKVLAMVLAGGRGERLYPLTKDRTKPAVPFGGIYRIIDFTLSNCLNSGIRKIYLLTQYKSFSLQRHIRQGWSVFDRELGEFVDLLPAQQRMHELWYGGTADAVYQNLYTLQQEKAEDTLILSGDHIYKMNYQQILSFHREKESDLTIATLKVPIDEASRFGVMEKDKSGRVTGFEEKPEHPKTLPEDPTLSLASMGVYIFKTDQLVRWLTKDAKRDTEHDFGKNIIPVMIKESRVFTFPFQDEKKKKEPYWRDIGTIDAYWKANMDLVNIDPQLNLYDESWPIHTYQGQYPPAKTVFSQGERTGLVLDSVICGGCIISGGKVQHSVLSPRVRINSYSEVIDSVLLEGVNVGRDARVRRAIVDKDVGIPSGMEIGYHLEEDRKRFTVTESGIVVVPKGMEWR
jgi:glucose-1-phosphate adenylyltransferase